MANTVIALKKSSTPSAAPSSLEFGEIAINYADGKLYYKNATSHIVEFTSGAPGGDAFGIVDANGTSLVSDQAGDTLTLIAGDFIEIVGDAAGDNVRFSANVTAVFEQANIANSTAISAFEKANNAAAPTISNTAPGGATAGALWWNSDTAELFIYYDDGSSSQWVQVASDTVLIGSVNDSAISAFDAANAAFDKANNNTGAIDSVNTKITQTNSNVANVTGAVSTANTNITNLTGAVDTANGNITSAFSQANTANDGAVGAFTRANNNLGAIITANANIVILNSNVANVIGAVTTANTNITNLTGAVDSANGDITSAFSKANTANDGAVGAFTRANNNLGAIITANANIVILNSNVANVIGAVTTANGNITNLQGGLDWANGQIVVAHDRANVAFEHANDAYNFANTISGGGASVSNTAPAGPTNGQLWFDSEYGDLYVYYDDGDSSQWVQLLGQSSIQQIAGDASGAYDAANGAFERANNNNNAIGTANANIVILNSNVANVIGAVTTANTNITNLTGAVDTANGNITSAFGKANSDARSISIIDPQNGDDITLFYTNSAIQITRFAGICRGTTPSITYTIRYASDRSATGTEVVTSGNTVTNTAQANVVTTFNSASISSGNFVWLEITALSGTVNEFSLTVDYNRS